MAACSRMLQCLKLSRLTCAGSGQSKVKESDQPGPSGSAQDDRDADAETELASVVKEDPLAAYDVDVRQEGMAIQEYLRMLQESVGEP